MMKLRALLMQLPVPNNTATNVPLAAGYLKAYAYARGLLDHVQVDILPRALADYAGDALLVEEIVARAPDVLGISLYTWNSERSLDIARRVKARLPALLVVVGGPEVQRDSGWVLRHAAIDVAVIGEGEQTFAELLDTLRLEMRDWRLNDQISNLQSLISNIDGLVFRDRAANLIFTPERAPLSDLAFLPSPYLLGYLEIAPADILMVEVSRWCPYSCSFCLYGRNMGPKLGSRYFGLDRLLAEIAWGRECGATRVHFIEANLNLVPVFWPLMRALADMNADGRMALYAELRGEHLTDAAVDALVGAGLRVAEVGLQTANPLALRASRRKTDLQKWAAGTRRLVRRGVEVYLDVILGLPADTGDGVAETLDFIQREDLGSYDIFTLQMLPGTGVRQQATEYSLVYQDRPPYYVLATDRFSYGDLRRLRRELKIGAGLDPDEVEGCPPPRLDALQAGRERAGQLPTAPATPDLRPLPVTRLDLRQARVMDWELANDSVKQFAFHVDIIADWNAIVALGALLERASAANPSTLFDCYLLADPPPRPEDLRSWRAALLMQPGYLDRVAVYRRGTPELPYDRVSPRIWLVLPWSAQAAPDDYAGVAEIIWTYDMTPGDDPPLGAWRAAGGAGVWARRAGAAGAGRWGQQTGLRIWHDGTKISPGSP